MTDLNEKDLQNNLNDCDIVYIDDITISQTSLKVIEENDEAYKELAK